MLAGGRVQALWPSGSFLDESRGLEPQGSYEVGRDTLMIVGRGTQGACT